MSTLEWEPLIAAVVIGISAIIAIFRMNHIDHQLTRLGDTLADIKTTLGRMRDRVDVIWDVLPKTFAKGTVYVNLPNIGRVAVSATPREGSVRYRVVADVPINTGAVVVYSKTSGLEKREQELLGGEVCVITELAPNAFLISVPTLDPSVATKMMNEYLEWIDREYQSLSGIKDRYEENILPALHIPEAEGAAWLQQIMPDGPPDDEDDDEDDDDIRI